MIWLNAKKKILYLCLRGQSLFTHIFTMKMRFFVSLALLFMQGSQLILTYAEDASITLLSQNDPLISLDHSFRKEKIDQAIIREARKNAEEYIQSLESDDRFWK